MKSQENLRLTFPEPDIGLITLDVQGRSANMLSRSLLGELRNCLNGLSDRNTVRDSVRRRNHRVREADRIFRWCRS